MSTQHTPGPWVIDKYGRIKAAGDDVLFRGVSTLASGAPDRIAMAEANTKLAAAGPDLLAAVKEAEMLLTKLWQIGFINVDDGNGELINLEEAAERMEAAIAKATAP